MIWLALTWDFTKIDMQPTHTLYFQHGEARSQLYLNWLLFFDISHLDSHAAYQSQTCLYSRLGIAKCIRIIVDIVSARCLGEGRPFERFISVRRERRHRGIAGCIYFHALSSMHT